MSTKLLTMQVVLRKYCVNLPIIFLKEGTRSLLLVLIQKKEDRYIYLMIK